jgi:flagellin-specific chaperone FliS
MKTRKSESGIEIQMAPDGSGTWRMANSTTLRQMLLDRAAQADAALANNDIQQACALLDEAIAIFRALQRKPPEDDHETAKTQT